MSPALAPSLAPSTLDDIATYSTAGTRMPQFMKRGKPGRSRAPACARGRRFRRKGRVFRWVCRAGKTRGEGVTKRVAWQVVKDCAKRAAIQNLARMTSAGPALDSATLPGDPDQFQFLLGHASVHTTGKYLAYNQQLQNAVNDRIGIKPST